MVIVHGSGITGIKQAVRRVEKLLELRHVCHGWVHANGSSEEEKAICVMYHKAQRAVEKETQTLAVVRGDTRRSL